MTEPAPDGRIGKPSLAALLKGSMDGALVRYRVMAFIVGSALIILVFVGVPLQLWAHVDVVAKVEGTIHGYLYLVYLFTAADVARRAHWRLGRIVAVVLSGFVPFLAFIVEHRVYRQMQDEWTVDAVTGGRHTSGVGEDRTAHASSGATVDRPG